MTNFLAKIPTKCQPKPPLQLQVKKTVEFDRNVKLAHYDL